MVHQILHWIIVYKYHLKHILHFMLMLPMVIEIISFTLYTVIHELLVMIYLLSYFHPSISSFLMALSLSPEKWFARKKKKIALWAFMSKFFFQFISQLAYQERSSIVYLLTKLRNFDRFHLEDVFLANNWQFFFLTPWLTSLSWSINLGIS